MQLKYAIAKDNPPKASKPQDTDGPVDDQGPKDGRKIHVNGFPFEWTNDDINSYFGVYVIRSTHLFSYRVK